jgi:hypothetical protein
MQKWIFIIGLCLCVAACKQSQTNIPVINPLKIDLPASYKSDTAAYHFIKKQTEAWSDYGKKVVSMYRQGEKFRKKDFDKLSPKEELALVTLDYEYALLWSTIDQHVSGMLLSWQAAMKNATPQGQGKLIETQRLFVAYYTDLSAVYGTDLKLDRKPHVFGEDEKATMQHRADSLNVLLQDSVEVVQDSLRQEIMKNIKD